MPYFGWSFLNQNKQIQFFKLKIMSALSLKFNLYVA